MDVTPLINSTAQVIQSYTRSGFKISHQYFESHVIVTKDDVKAWDVQNPENLQADDFTPIINRQSKPRILLLGTGANLTFPSKEIRQLLKGENIALEVMDTGAACRTYNVLMAEGRSVMTALLMPKDKNN